MSPMMLRFFTLVGAALVAASMQLKARAATEAPEQPAPLPIVAATTQQQ